MAKTAFSKVIREELKAAGCQLLRISRNSHEIYRGLTGATVTVPSKLDDHRKLREIRKLAGLQT